MPRAQVLARRNTHQRKKDRQALGTLRDLVVHPQTQSRYFTAVSRFLQFLQMHAYSYPTSGSSLDTRVSEYIEYLWESGEQKAFASDCLSGLGHFIPSIKRSLVGSWRLHGSWSRAELPCRALPFTPVVLYALAQQAFVQGWPDISMLLMLGFDQFARTGELFAAVKQDFVFNSSKTKVVWTLPLSKAAFHFCLLAGLVGMRLVWCPRVVPWSLAVSCICWLVCFAVSSVLADVGKTHLQSVAKHAKKVEWGEHYILYMYILSKTSKTGST